MKHLLLCTFLTLVMQVQLGAQCPSIDIVLTTQSQVDSFQVLYPNCTDINEDLTVGIGFFEDDTTSNINCLDSLMGIRTVSGSLYLIHNDSLKALSGLDSLKEVTSLLYIGNNGKLSNLAGLENLVESDRLDIRKNSSLKSFHGISGLNKVGDLYLSGNNSLLGFEGFEHLKRVGYLAILDNHGLINLNGFDSLGRIDRTMFISGNSQLETFVGLNALDTVDGEVFIYRNYKLKDCSVQGLCNKLQINSTDMHIFQNGVGCSSPDEIADSCGYSYGCPPGITFYSQDKIDDFKRRYPGCSMINGHVTVDPNFSINAEIHNFDSLSDINVIKGNLEFVNVLDAMNFIGFDNLDSIYGDLSIDRFTMLESLEGFNSLSYIEDELVVTGTQRLKSIGALSNLKYIGDDLRITWNDSLLSLDGLQDVDSLHGNIYIRGNNLLKNLEGLGQMNYVKGRLHIWGCDSLRSLKGLENLEFIGNEFYVSNNLSLRNFDDLKELDSIGGNLTISNNALLSNCAIQAICHYLKIPRGSVSINNNYGDCNTQEQIKSKCSSCPDCFTTEVTFWEGGGTDNNWHTESNWSSGIPSECHHVFIPNGAEVDIDETAECYTLSVDEGATILVDGQILRVACAVQN